jgi:superfamily II DNA or RNA helicase
MCIAGSIQLFSEGISVNPLSCVILTTLTSNPITLEQVIGRIMRLHEGKLDPEVMDITFSSYPERKQAEKRIEFYESKGWNVVKL